MGITTPRYSGNAVQRNRTKRIMREIYRHHPDSFPQEGALMFLIKKCAEREQIAPEMFRLSKIIMNKASQLPTKPANQHDLRE